MAYRQRIVLIAGLRQNPAAEPRILVRNGGTHGTSIFEGRHLAGRWQPVQEPDIVCCVAPHFATLGKPWPALPLSRERQGDRKKNALHARLAPAARAGRPEMAKILARMNLC
jgi:hypothetical protein